MAEYPLPSVLSEVLTQHSEPESLFIALLPALCEALQSDRCFLHLRNPNTRLYRSFCWRRSPDMPDISTDGWVPEEPWEQEDPMFAAALRTESSIFVEDIETASPEVLNVEFERQNLGHRALVHAHLAQDGKLWGILQPCVFDHPRQWSDADRSMIHQVTEQLTPIVVHYVQSADAVQLADA